MRTVDPVLWGTKVRKHSIVELARPFRFGRPALGFEARVRASFLDSWKEYIRHCSVRGVSCDQDDTRERKFRWLVVVCTMACGFGMVVNNCVLFRSTPPLLVSLQSSQHPIASIHFPAVAICSANVISKAALERYTDYLSSLDKNSTYSKLEISRQLLKYGGLIDLVAQEGVDELFVDFLRTLGQLNVTEILFKLSPNCSSMLLGCGWRGQPTYCEQLFAARLTPLGFCCIFNSRYSPEDMDTPAQMLDMVGSHNGLTVIARENSDDFLYRRVPVAGFEVLLFEGGELPLEYGGVIRRYLTTRNSSVFFSITVRAQEPAGGLATYSDEWRGCRIRALPGRLWRQSWCLGRCRQQAARALCSCEMLKPSSMRQCTPNHLSCLNKHREKFLLYYPRGEDFDFEKMLVPLSEELEAGLDCNNDCLPDCTTVTYNARISHVFYHYPEKLFHQNFFIYKKENRVLDVTNVTLMRFFYETEDQQLYSVEGYLRWYELVATIGCQWLFLLGLSVLSISEMVFHLTLRWFQLYLHRTRAQTTFKNI